MVVKRPAKKIVVKRKVNNQISRLVLLALAGTLFAGYLSYNKFFAKTCVLTEGCSYLFGIPTCFYGFTLFFLIFILSFSSVMTGIKFGKAIRFISILGILFSGSFTIYELFFAPINILNGASYSLLLPSCAYGLVFFLVIWILS